MSERIGVDFLRSIAMCAPGMTSSKDFYIDVWGLESVHSDDGVVYLRGRGVEPFIYALKDADHFGIDYINFGMTTRARLEGLFEQLKSEGADLISDIEEMTTPGGGVGFYMRDTHNRRLRIVADVAENADAGTHFAVPTKVSHVVLNSPDLKATEDFYHKTLGFRLSDYYVDRMSFMRCAHDHHSIGLQQNVHSSVNHVAFEMPDLDSYMRGIGRLKQHGLVPTWGPGRHGPGNNPFAYFVSPSGFVIEYTCELEQIDDATHVASAWTWGDPETSDRWMTAGPATPAMRTIMLGRPDRGFPTEKAG